MKISNFKKPMTAALAAFGAVLLAGCDAGGSGEGYEAAAALDPVLAEPQVGDLWAAKLDEFSQAEFGNPGDPLEDAYGLLKVTQVSDDRVIVITEVGAWPMASGTTEELRGNLSAITWDESEEIPINRTDIQDLVASGYILETRRMAP